MARRTPTACAVMEKPATRASPDVGGSSVVSILIVVVLPAPLEPSRPKTSPALTERVRASTAVNAPKRRGRFLISRTTSLMMHPGKCSFWTRRNEWGEYPIKFKPAKFRFSLSSQSFARGSGRVEPFGKRRKEFGRAESPQGPSERARVSQRGRKPDVGRQRKIIL